MAIAPFAGKLASKLFAIGILNAGFMGLVIVSLSTAYAFAEFFGLSGSLDNSFKQEQNILYLVYRPIDQLPPFCVLITTLPCSRLRCDPDH